MERNIKRVEKLVHATNSALAQMKFSLMFDDVVGGQSGLSRKADEVTVTKFFDADDLNECQNEFKSSANDMLAKMEKMFGSNESNRENWKALAKIKEINRKMNGFRAGESKKENAGLIQEKLLSLIGEGKSSSEVSPNKELPKSKQIVPLSKEKELLEKFSSVSQKADVVTNSNLKPKAELKNNILETRDIVDRGFQTARQLVQKVETMSKGKQKEKTPSSEKTMSEINFKSLEEKSESNEIVKTDKSWKRSEKRKKEKSSDQEIEKINFHVVEVREKEHQKSVQSKLRLQRLPSLHIRGGLKMQRIHSLEILGSEDATREKSNTSVSFLSHEQLKKEKLDKVLDQMKKENSFCAKGDSPKNYVECFNCGKLIALRPTWSDPRKIDEILWQCDFNVFDPRIDEFVEKFGFVKNSGPKEVKKKRVKVQSDSVMATDLKGKVKKKKMGCVNDVQCIQQENKGRHFTLQDFSDQLLNEYKKEAETLENCHSKLEKILKNLFNQVDESRKIFEGCYAINDYKLPSEGFSKMTATKPVSLVNSSVSKEKSKLDEKDIKDKTVSQTNTMESNMEAKKVHYDPASSQTSENSPEEISSSLLISHNVSGKLKTGEQFLENSLAQSIDCRKAVDHHKIRKKKVEAKSFSSSCSSRCANRPETIFRQHKSEETLTVIQSKNSKWRDRVCQKNESVNKVFVGSHTQSKMTKSPKGETVEVHEKKDSGALPDDDLMMISRSRKDRHSEHGREKVEEPKNFRSPSIHTSSLDSTIKSEIMEKEVLSCPSNESKNVDKEIEKLSFSEPPSERTESSYASDFESLTNELEDKKTECGNEESEPVLCVKKLSTISEVDSESENKSTSEQNTFISEALEQEKNLKQKEGSSMVSEMSTTSNKVDETPPKTAKASPKSSPTEVVTSLKDILSALKNQLSKTELLAEKLTENSNGESQEKNELNRTPRGKATSSAWKMPADAVLVENLQSTRKNWLATGPVAKSAYPAIASEKVFIEGKQESDENLSAESLSDEGGSSLGEIILSNRKKANSEASETSSISERIYQV